MPCEPRHPAPAPRINRAIGAVSVPDILPRRPIGEGLPLGDLGEESVSQSIQPPGHEMAAQEAEPETETSESVESPRVHPDVTPLVIPIALASPPQEFVDPAPEPARNGFSSGPVLLADLNDVPSESPRITAQPVPGEEGQNSDREALPVQSDVLSSAPLDSRRGVDGTHAWKPAVRVSLPPSEGVQTSSDPIGIQLDERRTQGSHAPHPWHPIAEGMATSNREAVLTSVPQGFAPQAGRVGARLQRLAGSSAAQQDMTLWGATPELEPVGRQAPLEESVQAPMTNAPAVIADPPVARQRQDAPSRRTVADGGASSRTGRLLGSLQVSAEVPDNGIAGGVAPQQGARSRSDATPLHVEVRDPSPAHVVPAFAASNRGGAESAPARSRSGIDSVQSHVGRQRNETSQHDSMSDGLGPVVGALDAGSAIPSRRPSLESSNRVPVGPRHRASLESDAANPSGERENLPDLSQSKVEAPSGGRSTRLHPVTPEVGYRGADRLEPVSGALSWTIPPQTAARVVGEERRVPKHGSHAVFSEKAIPEEYRTSSRVPGVFPSAPVTPSVLPTPPGVVVPGSTFPGADVGSRALTEATPDLHGIQPVVDSPSLRAVSGAESAAPWAGSGNPGEADGQGGGPPYQPLDESPPTADHSSRPPSQRVLAGRSSTPSRGGATAQASTPGPVESVPPPPGPLKETSSSPSRIPAGPESGQGIREGVPTGGRSRPPGRSDEVNSPGALSTLIGPGVHHLRDHETPPATEVLPGTPLRHDTPAGESLPRRMEIETLGQGRLQLTLTQQGQELRIDALELGNALSGTEAGWQELQSRLEGAGILLGPLESAPQQPGFTGDRNPHDPRHAACYESGMNSSGQPDSAPDSQVRKRILIPDAPADSAQVHRGSKGVVPGRTRGTGREWWA